MGKGSRNKAVRKSKKSSLHDDRAQLQQAIREAGLIALPVTCSACNATFSSTLAVSPAALDAEVTGAGVDHCPRCNGEVSLDGRWTLQRRARAELSELPNDQLVVVTQVLRTALATENYSAAADDLEAIPGWNPKALLALLRDQSNRNEVASWLAIVLSIVTSLHGS